jgi:multisubunit Na+/H+ antiporter MnhG subunit
MNESVLPAVALVFLYATLPVSSHMLARAALREQDPDEHIDEIPLAGGERSPNARKG